MRGYIHRWGIAFVIIISFGLVSCSVLSTDNTKDLSSAGAGGAPESEEEASLLVDAPKCSSLASAYNAKIMIPNVDEIEIENIDLSEFVKHEDVLNYVGSDHVDICLSNLSEIDGEFIMGADLSEIMFGEIALIEGEFVPILEKISPEAAANPEILMYGVGFKLSEQPFDIGLAYIETVLGADYPELYAMWEEVVGTTIEHISLIECSSPAMQECAAYAESFEVNCVSPERKIMDLGLPEWLLDDWPSELPPIEEVSVPEISVNVIFSVSEACEYQLYIDMVNDLEREILNFWKANKGWILDQ